MSVCFTYRCKVDAGQMTLFTREDREMDDYVSLRQKLGELPTLYLSRTQHAHPFGHKETKEEMEARLSFRIDQWDIVAAVYAGQEKGIAGFTSALLINKANPHFAYVVELIGLQAVESIFGEWNVEIDGDLYEEKEVLDEFNAAPAPRRPAPKPEEGEVTVSVARPAFEPGGKKPGRIGGYTPKPQKPEIVDDEEESAPTVSFERPAFEANSSKKPRKISLGSGTKPQLIAPNMEEETEDGPVSIEPVTPGPFAPASSKKPKNLNDDHSSWRSMSFYRYRTSQYNTGERNLILDYGNSQTLPYFEKAKETLRGLASLATTDFCIFSPRVPLDGFPDRRLLRNFSIDEWDVLSLNLNSYNEPISFLLSNKERPKLCIVVSGRGQVFAVCFEGVTVAGESFCSFDDLLKRLEKPKPKPAPIKVETPAPKPKAVVVEDEEPLEEEEKVVLVPRRRVFVASPFLKSEQRFIDKYHAQAREDFEQTVKTFITATDEELDAFLRSKDAKPITDRNGVTIWKFRFGSSREYIASRLFFCHGYDLDRRMNEDDYLFLGLTDQGEHEEQGEVSALFARMFDSPNDLVLYQRLLPAEEEADLDQIAYMSKRQFSYLKEAQSAMPMAFLGSAGTGKTLLSLQHYLSLKEEGKRVLYLTYQKSLCDEVRRKLKELGAENVEALTYRDLCFSLFGDEAKAMRTKRRYRKWFMDYVYRTGPLQSKLRLVGPTVEDQFMTCYVFYRGVIDGSLADYEHRTGGILTREQFLEEVSNEEGFSAKAKDIVYDVALAYEKHLKKHEGTTDNKLAWKILERQGKLARYDAIVIDEFQDLSEVQFKAIVSLIKPADPLPLFIYGDENQAINPTIFNFSDANIILHQLFGDAYRFNQRELNDSFRSGPNLVHYINDVNRVKRQAIGARKQEEELEVSLREDEEDLFATLVEGEDKLERLISVCARGDKDVVFIFPSILRREKIAEQYRHVAPEFVESAFLSVEEAKGREWDSVVLVDFFHSSSTLFEAMLGEERSGRHSTIHRMLFNRFYVALTRARNRIVVFESEVTPLIREKLLSGLTPLEDIDSLSSYFQGSVEGEAWTDFGKRLMQEGKYDAAYRALSRAEGEEAKALSALCHQYMRIERDEMPFGEARDFCLSQLDYKTLKDLYDEQGLLDRCAFLDLARDRDADPNYVYEAYLSLEPTLSLKEKEVFSSLTAKKLMRRIKRLLP